MDVHQHGKHETRRPDPFILLNLILSCLAAVQAPVIMMSQNRQAAKDTRPRTYKAVVTLQRRQLELLERIERTLSSRQS